MRTVLVVEDDLVVLEITSELLQELGYHVVQAATAQDALSVVHGKRIDLVLLDKTLPDAEGPDIVPQLLAALPDIKVILCSGDTMPAGYEALPAGIIDTLPKPFSLEGLKDILKKYLG